MSRTGMRGALVFLAACCFAAGSGGATEAGKGTKPGSSPATVAEIGKTGAEFRAVIAALREEAGRRRRVLPRTLVFSRSQMKYWLNTPYYHIWLDRPLFVNRELGGALDGYRFILETVRRYGMDGLAFQPLTKNRMVRFAMTDQAAVPGIQLLPEVIHGGRDPQFAEVIKNALRTESVPRIDGKVLIIGKLGARSPEELRDILAEIRREYGDRIVCVPDLYGGGELLEAHREGTLTRAAVEAAKAPLRAYLDVADGLYDRWPARFQNKDRGFDRACWEELVIPLYRSVLAEPPYRGKYLVLGVHKSHMMPERGHSLHEDGTRTLRRCLEPVLEAEPDVINLVEWDEQNENTSWRPTLYNGTAPLRLLRYYTSRLRGVAPAPEEGDDTSLPNLILSTRAIVTLGEQVIVELLNVPDSARSSRYRAELSLEDENGEVVFRGEPVGFDSAVLREERYTFPTEDCPRARALVPVLAVRDYQGRDMVVTEGFQHIQVRGTWNWNYLYVKQPLRDLLRPSRADLTLEAGGPAAPCLVRGAVTSPEPLAFVELVADDDEVFAVDPTDEFFRNDPEREILMIEYRSIIARDIAGTLTIRNANEPWLAKGAVLRRAEAGSEPPSRALPDYVLQMDGVANMHGRYVLLAMPAADQEAELVFESDALRFTVPVRDVFDRKMVSYAAPNGLSITLSPYRKQFNMPSHLKAGEATFAARVWPEMAAEQYHLRLTSTSGKVFRSRPLVGPGRAPETEALRIYSAAKGCGVDVRVAADRIPDIVYEFVPERGAVLLTAAGRPFWGSLGGYAATVTGRGAWNQMFDSSVYPEPFSSSAPAWCMEDGRPCLRFDGRHTYLNLPLETLPQRGSFTVELDVKPTAEKDQYLLATRILSRAKGLVLEIRDGALHGSFRGQDRQTRSFPTRLAVPVNEWSAIKVTHDLEQLRFEVNGREEVFPLNQHGCNNGYLVIGDGGWRYPSDRWFEGCISSVRIRHNVRPRPGRVE